MIYILVGCFLLDLLIIHPPPPSLVKFPFERLFSPPLDKGEIRTYDLDGSEQDRVAMKLV